MLIVNEEIEDKLNILAKCGDERRYSDAFALRIRKKRDRTHPYNFIITVSFAQC